MNDTTPLAQLPGFDKLGGRAKNILEACNVYTLADLKKITGKTLAEAKNCGAGTKNQILDLKASLVNGTPEQDAKKSKTKKSSDDAFKGGKIFDDLIVLDEVIEEHENDVLDTALIAFEVKRIRLIEKGQGKFTRVAYDSDYELVWHRVVQSFSKVLQLRNAALKSKAEGFK